MPAKFDGASIFGQWTRQLGTTPRHRWQEAAIPGLPGARIYDLGPDGAQWTIRGRIVKTDLSYGAAVTELMDAILLGSSYVDAQLYDFQDVAGNVFNNCLLTNFAQAGELQACLYNGLPACTTLVSATIRWMLPE